MLTKIFYTAVVGFWLWQEEIDCPNAAVCCPFVCSVSYRKCHFNAQVKAFLLSTFADLYDSWSLCLFFCVSLDLFTSSPASSLWASCRKPRPTSLIWPLIWTECEDDDTALYTTFPHYTHLSTFLLENLFYKISNTHQWKRGHCIPQRCAFLTRFQGSTLIPLNFLTGKLFPRT